MGSAALLNERASLLAWAMARQEQFSAASSAACARLAFSSISSFNRTTSTVPLLRASIPFASSHATSPLPSTPLLFDYAAHDLLCTFAVLGTSLLWIRFFEFLVRRNVLEQNLSRKLVHISSGILYALLWPVFSMSPSSRYFALAIPFANALRLLLYGLGLVTDEAAVKCMSRSGSSRELLGGPFSYVMVLSICTIFFWRDSPVGMVALATMCGGDGIADIIGRRLGAIKLPHNSSKSWAGSVAMVVFGFLLSVSLMYYYTALGFYRLKWSCAVQTVGMISIAAAIVESLPISAHLDDNMSVPLVSVLMGLALLPRALL